MMLVFAVGVLAVSASGVQEEDGNALSLLQTSSLKVSEQSSNKDCKAAKAAYQDARTKVKTDKAARKAARKAVKAAQAALKAAKATKEESEKAAEVAYGKMAEVCPIPEVDLETPDEGCSGTIVTSFMGKGIHDLLNPANCNKYNGLANHLDKFDKCLPGGGVPGGHGKAYGDKLGIAIMQPCSVAWTSGGPIVPRGTLSTGFQQVTNTEIFKVKTGLRDHHACLDWAKSVAPWPESYAVTFGANCQVHKKTTIPWKNFGPSLQLTPGNNIWFSCYLGNKAAWKKQYEEQQAENQLIDKCSKPVWSRWKLHNAEPPVVPSGTPFKWLPMASSTKECYQNVKAEPVCGKAVAVRYKEAGGWCQCIYQTPAFEGDSRGYIDEFVCML